MFALLLWNPWIGSVEHWKNKMHTIHCHAARIFLEVLWWIPEHRHCHCSSLPDRPSLQWGVKGSTKGHVHSLIFLVLKMVFGSLFCYFGKGGKWEQLESSLLPLLDLISFEDQLSSRTQSLTLSLGEFEELCSGSDLY